MIPATIEDVTQEWLSEVLDVPLTAINKQQIGQGVGLMGDIFKVELTSADSSAPRSVVVKLPSSFDENREQGVALGMFDAEVKFYAELSGQADVGIPRIYHAEIVSGTPEFVIVMEDLSHLDSVAQSDGMSFEQAKAAVEVLAHIHAVWWDKVRDEPSVAWIPTMIGPRIEYIDGLFAEVFPAFEAGFGQVLPEGGLDIYKKFAGNYLKINTVLAERSPWTLAHQDYRVENLLFGKAGSGEAVVLDWQGIGLGPGAYDLAYTLGGSVDTDIRRANERELVAAYHQTLLECGIENYSFDQLYDDYGHAQLMGGLATALMTGATLDLSNERGKQLVTTMAVRHVTAAMDHDGAARLADIVG